MKKADEIRQIFGARVAVLIERNGVLYAYQSHEDFPATLPRRLKECNKTTPEDFITVRQQHRSTKAPDEGKAESQELTANTTPATPNPSTCVPQPSSLPKTMQRDYFELTFEEES